MGIDIDAILKNMGIKDQFDSKAKEAINNAKAQSDDQSVFESKDKFVEHYTNELFGGSANDEIEMDEGFFKKINVEDEEEIQNFYQAFDGRDGKDPDQKLSRDEAGLLLGAAYDSASEKPELYNTVELQAWGTKDDDCLSRIINKHVDGVKLYSEDYNTYLNEMCKLNGIEDPNVVQTGKQIKMPEIKADSEGNFIRDEDGNIQFYSEEELSNMKGIEDNKQTTTQTSDGTNILSTFDDKGRIIAEECTRADGVVVSAAYEYNDDGTAKKIEKAPDGWHCESEVDAQGRETKGKVTDANGNTHEYTYTYNSDNSYTKTINYEDNTKQEIEFDSEGKMTKHTNYDSENNVSDYYTFEYDADGNRTEKHFDSYGSELIEV